MTGGRPPTIEPHANADAFFRDKVAAALKRRRVETVEETEFYLVRVLAGHARAAPAEILGQPLTERLARAVEATGHDALSRFTQLGDLALFVSGFFAEHLDSRGVSRRFVSELGGQAYWAARSLASRIRGAAPARDPRVYAELASQFDAFVGVFDDVREETTLRTPQDVLRLYERWCRTGSPLVARRLQAEGVFPQATADDNSAVH